MRAELNRMRQELAESEERNQYLRDQAKHARDRLSAFEAAALLQGSRVVDPLSPSVQLNPECMTSDVKLFNHLKQQNAEYR